MPVAEAGLSEFQWIVRAFKEGSNDKHSNWQTGNKQRQQGKSGQGRIVIIF